MFLFFCFFSTWDQVTTLESPVMYHLFQRIVVTIFLAKFSAKVQMSFCQVELSCFLLAMFLQNYFVLLGKMKSLVNSYIHLFKNDVKRQFVQYKKCWYYYQHAINNFYFHFCKLYRLYVLNYMSDLDIFHVDLLIL